MLIKDEEINLRITPKGIQKVEEKYKDFDILGILRDANKVEPRASDYYKIIYTAYVTVKYIDNQQEIDLEYDSFLDEYLNGISLAEISQVGVSLLIKGKN